MTVDVRAAQVPGPPPPTSEIDRVVAEHNLPASREDARDEGEARARAAGVLHALVQFEAEYRGGLLGGTTNLGAPKTLCASVGRHAVDMAFHSSWTELAQSARDVGDDDRPFYMEGVLDALRSMVRSLEIELEQVVLDHIDEVGDDDAEGAEADLSPLTADENELISLLYIALTSATPARLSRAFGSAFDMKVVEKLVSSGFLSTHPNEASIDISPAGAERARSLLAHT